MSYAKRQQETKKKHSKLSEKINGSNFQPLRYDFINSSARISLSSAANKLMLDLMSQYMGNNNGDLSCAFDGIMKPLGWRSEATLRKAIKELQKAGILILTRQGGRNKTPNLYALSCYAINECGGKINCNPTNRATDEWKQFKEF